MADPISKPPQWASASRDDRGKKVRIYRAGTLGLPRWTDHPVPKEEWERIRWAGVPDMLSRPRPRFHWVSELLGTIVLIWIAVSNLNGRMRWISWAIFIVLIAQFAVPMLGRRTWVWNSWVNMIGAMLSHKRCAQCAYPIGDVPAAEDGCVVCPECGAAWFAAFVGKPMQTMAVNPAGES